MSTKNEINQINIKHLNTFMYLPPITWKGDCIGHIGNNDTFFWVLEGECFLLIEENAYIVRPGQLAFLPKGKKRAYTHVSDRFIMYEMAFSAESENENLMESLGLNSNNFVVEIESKDVLSELFENSHRIELFKDPIYNIASCANVLNIIKMYLEARNEFNKQQAAKFDPVLKFMSDSINQNVTTDQLAKLVYMQPTYFIRKFKNVFKVAPQKYFGQLKLFKAMNLLASTNISIEEVALSVGMNDTSYFSRFFKKGCNVTPTEFRKAFKK